MLFTSEPDLELRDLDTSIFGDGVEVQGLNNTQLHGQVYTVSKTRVKFGALEFKVASTNFATFLISPGETKLQMKKYGKEQDKNILRRLFEKEGCDGLVMS